MILTLGFSTCPNDTFIFDALVHGKVETEGITYRQVLADVEELNRKAFNNELDITKLSFHTYGKVAEEYVLLDAGSALGRGNGPLLISKMKIYPDEVPDLHIAIPGENTTANLLLSIKYPEVRKKTEYLFSDIEEVVLSEETDAGLIIHENRFTYKKKGLRKIIDLGEYWEEDTGLPIPLGGIALRRNLPEETKRSVNRSLKRSIEFALTYPHSSADYIKTHAQELKEDVIRKHIDLYVNDFTVNLGEEGKIAILKLYEKAVDSKLLQPLPENLFL